MFSLAFVCGNEVPCWRSVLFECSFNMVRLGINGLHNLKVQAKNLVWLSKSLSEACLKFCNSCLLKMSICNKLVMDEVKLTPYLCDRHYFVSSKLTKMIWNDDFDTHHTEIVLLVSAFSCFVANLCETSSSLDNGRNKTKAPIFFNRSLHYGNIMSKCFASSCSSS